MTTAAIRFVTVALLAVLFACDGTPPDAPPQRRTPVTTVPVRHEIVRVPIHTTGLVAARSESRLAFKIGGMIADIAVREGDRVRSGQLLARLDPAEIDAEVSRARSARVKAARDLARVRNLFADSVATLEQLQNAETGLEMARSALAIAEFNQRHSEIRAPADGRILHQFAEPNEMVGPGTPVFRFGALDQNWIVRVGLAERQVIRVAPGDSARIRVAAWPDRELDGVIAEVASAMDPASATFEVEVVVESTPVRLMSGFTAQVQITPATGERLAVIPPVAVTEGEGREAVVYLPDGDGQRAIRRPVTVARILERGIAVADGLQDVDAVIADGAAYLVDGAPIVVRNAALAGGNRP